MLPRMGTSSVALHNGISSWLLHNSALKYGDKIYDFRRGGAESKGGIT